MADGTAPKTMKEVMEMLFEPKMSKIARDVEPEKNVRPFVSNCLFIRVARGVNILGLGMR